MKKAIIILSTIILSFNNSQAQLFSESVKIFDVKFKAKAVNGQKRFTGVEDGFRSKILNPLIVKDEDEYLSNVGTFRNNVYTAQVRSLLDLSTLNQGYKHLDFIDFNFYEGRGFDIVLNKYPKLEQDKLFNSLVDRIKKEEDYSKKKEILFERQYRKIRLKLIATRYEVRSNPFSLSKRKISKFTAKLKVKVDSLVVSNNLSSSGKIRGYLEKLADETTVIRGIYHIVSLNKDYVNFFKDYVRDNIVKIRKDAKQSGFKYRFAKNLLQYMSSSNSVINSSLAAIQLQGDIDKQKVNVTNISADLQAKFNVPADKALNVATSVKVTFEKHKTVEFDISFSSVFIIRYFSSSILNEIKQL